MDEVRRVTIPKLDVDTYATWSTLVELVLEIKGFWDTVAYGLVADADAETKKRDRKARAEIGLCLEFHHLANLKDCKIIVGCSGKALSGEKPGEKDGPGRTAACLEEGAG